MIYEYKCPSCDTILESDERKAHIQCTCKGKNSPYRKRMYNFGGVTFRGPGFYKTDSKPKGSDNG